MTQEVIKEVIIVSTPESAKSKHNDCSVNSPENEVGRSVPSDLKRKEKPAPNYLRASTGSCHDNCKFGVYHSPESKKYWPVRRRRQDRANAGHGKQDQDEITPQKGRLRNKDLSLKISLVSDGSAPDKTELMEVNPTMEMALDNSESLNSPCVQEFSAEVSERVEAGTLPCDVDKCLMTDDNIVACCLDRESSEGAVSIELEMPLAIQDSDASEDCNADVILTSECFGKTGEQLLVNDVCHGSENELAGSEKRNTQIVMVSEMHEKSGHGTESKSLHKESVKPKAKQALTTGRNNFSSQKTGRTSDRKASGTTVESSNGSKVVRTTKANRDKKSSSTVASNVPKVNKIRVISPANVIDQSSKPTRLSKLKALIEKHDPSPSVNSVKQIDRKMIVKNVVKNAHVWQKNVEEKVILSPVKLSRSINMSAKSLLNRKMRAIKKEKAASPMNSNKKVYGAETVDADTKKKNLKSASPKVRKVEVNKKEILSQKERSSTPRTENTSRTKSATISSTIQTQPPRKLTFRRGKVLNLQSNSESNNTPRRLRFRPAKTVEDSNRSKESTTRGGRTTRKSDNNATSSGSKDSGSSKPEIVVLRHQDVCEKKKNDQGLFNNVIEETANKLVEARKSKVKALVGAFETVISLQERKVVACLQLKLQL